MNDIPEHPFPRGSVREYIDSLRASPRFGGQVVFFKRLPSEPARFSPLKRSLAPELEEALRGFEVRQFYTHQAQALDLAREGEDILVATPTASGKSLIYTVPLLERVLSDPSARALLLFPLKALAQDQLKSLAELAAFLPGEKRPGMMILDGDTSSHHRRKIRENPPNLLLSNPDMLHLSLLGYHDRWSDFLSSLTLVVVDEVHTYRGIFGSHVAWVLRRLQRICRTLGNELQFIMSSATVGNPAELGRALIGREPVVVEESGSPRGERSFLFLDPLESAAGAACQLLEAAVKRGLRTIVYTQSRRMTELIALWTAPRLGPLKERLAAYRAGYLPEERREIEARLARGTLLGVVSTSALELGIDIGSLDICILVGYPGTIMQAMQRSGRVGRSGRDSLTILVGGEDALDQYFLRNPEEFFSRPVESAVLNPFNQVIGSAHLVCAAAELPLSRTEELLQHPQVRKLAEELTRSGALQLSASGDHYHTGRRYPHREVSLRGSGRTFLIRKEHDGEALGEIDAVRALKECHPGAIYLHRGKTWKVLSLDFESRVIVAGHRKVNYFTRPLGEKETEILEVAEHRVIRGVGCGFGTLKVTDQVVGFQKRSVRGQHLLATERLELPPTVFETEGIWIELPDELPLAAAEGQVHFMGGIHAVEHAVIGVMPLMVLCDRNDVGGIAYPLHPQLKRPAVFLYDGYPGGVGICRHGFGRMEELLDLARTTIASCPCETGCPSCVHSPKCGSGNRPIDKDAALFVLARILEPGSVSGRLGGGYKVEGSGFAGETRGGARVAPGRAVAGKRSAPKRYGVFDLETKRSAAEVGGWHRAERMGMSVAVVYDSGSDEFLAFTEPEVEQLIQCLKTFDLVVGFNNRRFDNLVLSAYTDADLKLLPTLDILQAVRDRLGYRLSLDHLASQTLGVEKSGDGLKALEWYRKGEMERLIDYCRQDVRITRDLYLFGKRNGYLLFRNKAGALVRCPVDFP